MDIIDNYSKRLNSLREQLKSQNITGFILPVTDEYQGEYSAPYARRVTWLSGFDGSAGTLVILANKAALFVDGRYTIQARDEVNSDDYEIYNIADKQPSDYLQEHLGKGDILLYDPWLHTKSSYNKLKLSVEEYGINIEPCGINLIDKIWKDQPPRPSGESLTHPIEYAGKTADDKCQEISQQLRDKNIDAAFITLPDSVCWLLNIRGDDIPYNPLPLHYAVLSSDGSVQRFTPQDTNKISEYIKTLSNKTIAYDPIRSPVWFYHQLVNAGAKISEQDDICLLPKSLKNQVEQEGMRQAHILDGVAITRFLHWFDNLPADKTITELDVEAKLESFRKDSADYRGASFATIAGAGEHGAIVHYRVKESTNREIHEGDVLLLDSGGQYPFGTTDITRTMVRGECNDNDFKSNYTAVLKGHIALSQAYFPQGTSGSQLDALARQPLWELGLDYDHGTGHGVGSYLCVHEGPQRIGKRGGDVALQDGMIISNEPGYYLEGEYGIRHENLVMVTNNSKKQDFLQFETITLAPFDISLIEVESLNQHEINWLNNYNQKIYNTLSPLLDDYVRLWLGEKCMDI